MTLYDRAHSFKEYLALPSQSNQAASTTPRPPTTAHTQSPPPHSPTPPVIPFGLAPPELEGASQITSPQAKTPAEPDPHPLHASPSSDLTPAASPSSGRQLSHDKVTMQEVERQVAARETKVQMLRDRLEEVEAEGSRLGRVIRAKDEEVARVHEKSHALEAEVVQLRKELKESKKKEADAVAKAKMPLTFDVVGVDDALKMFGISAGVSDQVICAKYKSLLASNPSLAKQYHGAFYAIGFSRLRNPKSILCGTMTAILMDEMRTHFSSISLSLTTEFISFHLDMLGAESARIATKPEAKLAQLRKELKSAHEEAASWRAKSQACRRDTASIIESADKAQNYARGLMKEHLIVMADRENEHAKQRELTKKAVKAIEMAMGERDEAVARVEVAEGKLAEVEQAKAHVVEVLKEMEKRIVEKEAELSSFVAEAQEQASSSMVSAGLPHTPSEAQAKFVIQKLAATVKTLNAELAAKSLENAELISVLSLGTKGNDHPEWRREVSASAGAQ